MSLDGATRRATTSDIARAVGVSRATVGYVLNDTPGQTISPTTRKRVLAEAERLQYRPSRAARALASGQSHIVLLVLPDWPIEHSLGTNLEEASLALDEAGYSLVTWTPHAEGRARPLWETLQPDVVLGLTPLDPDQRSAILASGAKLVDPAAAETESTGEGPAFNVGPELQVSHLVESGRRRLAFASPSDPRLSSLAQDRYDLAERTAARLGVHIRRDEVPDARALVHEWLADDITGVVGYNDDVAAAVLGAAIRAGIQVPDELAVVGHDDAPISRLLMPSLSTINVDTAGLGRYLAGLALHTAEGTPMPRAGIATNATLVHRESS